MAVPGNPDGCEDCLAIGAHDWVLTADVPALRARRVLRLLAAPARHGHFSEVGHPVMRSIELGEGWRWCFVDKVAG